MELKHKIAGALGFVAASLPLCGPAVADGAATNPSEKLVFSQRTFSLRHHMRTDGVKYSCSFGLTQNPRAVVRQTQKGKSTIVDDQTFRSVTTTGQDEIKAGTYVFFLKPEERKAMEYNTATGTMDKLPMPLANAVWKFSVKHLDNCADLSRLIAPNTPVLPENYRATVHGTTSEIITYLRRKPLTPQ